MNKVYEDKKRGGYYYKYSINGKQHRTKRYSKAKDAAIAGAREELKWRTAEVESANDKDVVTVLDVAKEYFDLNKSNLKISTLRAKETLIKNYISKLKRIEITELNKTHLDKFHNDLSKLKLTSARKNAIQSYLVNVLKYAVTFYKIEPSLVISLTKFKDLRVMSTAVNFWTKDEFLKFISAFEEDDRYRVFFESLYYSGLRIGEILGLTWGDYSKGSFNVNKQIDKYNNITTPKSKNSYRIVLLPKVVTDKLDQCPHIDKHIFPYSRTHLERVKNEHCALAKVKQIRIHDFRHSHVSLLVDSYISSGKTINFLAIANRMGHSVEETMDTYSHMYPDRQTELLNMLQS